MEMERGEAVGEVSGALEETVRLKMRRQAGRKERMPQHGWHCEKRKERWTVTLHSKTDKGIES